MKTSPERGCTRVSTEDPNLDLRQEASTALGVEVRSLFTDKVPGKSTEHLELLMRLLRHGESLYVTSMERVSRSLCDLLDLTTALRDRGVAVHILKERIDLVVPAKRVAKDLNVGGFPSTSVQRQRHQPETSFAHDRFETGRKSSTMD